MKRVCPPKTRIDDEGSWFMYCVHREKEKSLYLVPAELLTGEGNREGKLTLVEGIIKIDKEGKVISGDEIVSNLFHTTNNWKVPVIVVN